jgi:hypothetical protein
LNSLSFDHAVEKSDPLFKSRDALLGHVLKARAVVIEATPALFERGEFGDALRVLLQPMDPSLCRDQDQHFRVSGQHSCCDKGHNRGSHNACVNLDHRLSFVV